MQNKILKRKIGIVTVARSGYSILKPIMLDIIKDKHLALILYVTGSHLLPEYGYSIKEIENDGFKINFKVDMKIDNDSPSDISNAMGVGIIEFGKVFKSFRPDILLVMGDRYEVLSAVVASLPYNIVIAHLRGGETTFGAIDESIRHSISKMSHLHFVANKLFKKRLQQMGEESKRIKVVGDPALESIKNQKSIDLKDLEKKFKIHLSNPSILITFHPVTREYDKTSHYIKELLKALSNFNNYNLIFTYPNTDTYGKIIIKNIKTFSYKRKNCYVVKNFGNYAYYSILKHVKLMVGNSSSGIWEASSFKLPVVNIGIRQLGRLQSKNIINSSHKSGDIIKCIKKGLSKNFKEKLKNLKNPYFKSNSKNMIINNLKQIKFNQSVLIKKFIDIKEG